MKEKKMLPVYLDEQTKADYKEACKEMGRSMTAQTELMIKKVILNSKRKQSK